MSERLDQLEANFAQMAQYQIRISQGLTEITESIQASRSDFAELAEANRINRDAMQSNRSNITELVEATRNNRDAIQGNRSDITELVEATRNNRDAIQGNRSDITELVEATRNNRDAVQGNRGDIAELVEATRNNRDAIQGNRGDIAELVEATRNNRDAIQGNRGDIAELVESTRNNRSNLENLGQTTAATEAQLNRMEIVMESYLTRIFQGLTEITEVVRVNQIDIANLTLRIDSLAASGERHDRILDYLLRREQDNNGGDSG
ncbi:MAG: hypothetical protein AAF921_20760 [Cyanobacteria bacterium P01_D01_bin.44]